MSRRHQLRALYQEHRDLCESWSGLRRVTTTSLSQGFRACLTLTWYCNFQVELTFTDLNRGSRPSEAELITHN